MPGEQMANSPLQLIPYLVIPLIFYFLFFKPEKDERNARKKKLAAIKKNDQVITSGGIHGTVVNVKETSVILRVDDNVKMEVEKSALVTVKES